MKPAPITMSNLISHRFRGFSKYENTLDGLRAALDFGVINLEFDVRMAACGTPMVYHDEYAKDARGKVRHLCDLIASSFKNTGGDFARMPTFEALLDVVASHKNTEAKLLVDIKDAGFEHEIHALLSLYRMQDRAVYVSWLPEVLYALDALAPTIPKCLSHWCQPVNALIRAHHKVFKSKDGNIPLQDSIDFKGGYIMGVRSGWQITAPIKGQFLDLLKRSQGGICVPQDMATKELCQYYQGHGLFVSTFSYTDKTHLMDHRDTLGIDLYFIDNKKLFIDLT
ncbi:MAG: glycerophosphodiester phosphodiesterase [Hyphomonadaceae bacterium]|nr:glycerophosphodiester phosphodiesterase [Hyphomonadaceae bacterium]